MSTTHEDVANLKKEIVNIYTRKKTAIYALCVRYASFSLKRFRQKQARDKFFHNRTEIAYNTAFSDAVRTKEYIMFFLALAVDYGWPLELANDRKHESVRPTVMAFYSRFMRDLEEIC